MAMREMCFTVSQEDAGKRIDAWLASREELQLTRSSVQNLLENWGVYSFFGTSRSPLTENLTVSALADPFSNTYGAVLALRF